MVVASKVEVDACLFDSIRQLGKILLAAASRVGVIDRNMRNQDLPVAVGCRCVLHQPILELFKLVLAARIVEHGDIDIAIFDRVPIAGKVEGLLCKSCAIAVVIRLMVSYDMQHVLVGNAIERKELEGVGPLVVVAYVIHCIAQLDSEIIPAILDM